MNAHFGFPSRIESIVNGLRRLPIVLAGLALPCGASVVAADEPPPPQPAPVETMPTVPEHQDFEDLFRPFRTDHAVISPDGAHIAFSVHENGRLSVMIVRADAPDKVVTAATLMRDEDATAGLDINTREATPARIDWMRWVSPTRLVMATNAVVQLQVRIEGATDFQLDSDWNGYPGAVLALDIDGSGAKVLATAKTLAELPKFLASVTQRPVFTRFWTKLPAELAFASTSTNTVDIATEPRVALPRSPRVLGCDPESPQTLIVLAEGIGSSETLRIDAMTGSAKSVEEIGATTPVVPLFDQQGHLRMQIAASTLDRFPHAFRQTGRSDRNKRNSGSGQLPADLAAEFQVSPDNYFGERAVPLGFDAKGTTMYFASNVGRNTFGVYGFDMTTGQKTSFSVEHPELDLYEPMPGVYPDPAQSVPPRYLVGQGERERYDMFDEADDETVDDTTTTDDTTETEDDLTLEEGTAPRQTRIAHHVLEAGMRAFSHALRLTMQQQSPQDNSPLVFDPLSGDLVGIRLHAAKATTIWLQPEIRAAQATLESVFPNQSVEIRDWDSKRERFVALIYSAADPGAFYLFERTSNRAVEFVSRAPWLAREAACPTVPIVIPAADGGRLTGQLTLPRAVRVATMKKLPLVVLCQEQPWLRVASDYTPEAQALARMGVAVLQINPRGTWGFGRNHRTAMADDFAVIQSADIVAAVDNLTQRAPINPKRVAVFGNGLGGHLALRAAQEHPDRFRCAVAIEAPISLKGWRSESRRDRVSDTQLLRSFFSPPGVKPGEPLIEHPETLTRPVCVFAYSGDSLVPARNLFSQGRQLTNALRSAGQAAEFVHLDYDYLRKLPKARADIFQYLEGFFNVSLYDFKVETGDTYISDEP